MWTVRAARVRTTVDGKSLISQFVVILNEVRQMDEILIVKVLC